MDARTGAAGSAGWIDCAIIAELAVGQGRLLRRGCMCRDNDALQTALGHPAALPAGQSQRFATSAKLRCELFGLEFAQIGNDAASAFRLTRLAYVTAMQDHASDAHRA